MIKKICFFLIFIPGLLHAQFTIKGSIKPANNYTWILLYKLENGQQTFVDNAAVANGEFQFKIKESEPSGIYRAYYQIENNLYVEFIYNKEDVNFSFDGDNPKTSILFLSSEENKIYQEYYKNITLKQNELDALQIDYFKSNDAKADDQISKAYQNTLKELQAVQSGFELKSENKLAHHFIKASKQYNATTPFKKPEEYLAQVKFHFFDAIDFNDTVLTHSTFVNDRLTDYVLYLNQADNITSKNLLQKNSIEKIIPELNNHFELLKNFEETLLQNYMAEENIEMIDFLNKGYYQMLPDSYQDAALQYKIIALKKTAIGSEAADFSWEENGVNKNLHGLIGFDYYILAFFSSSCPHCQVEMPEFHTFIKDIENIRVVTVGLEDEKEPWVKMTSGFSEFTNILDLDKWQSQKVKDYGLSEIPSFFVLDANKNILAKPNDVEALKSMFETK